MKLNFSLDDIKRAHEAGVLDLASAERLMTFLMKDARSVVATGDAPARIRFDLAHVLWYVGALIIMSAMGLFSTLAFTAMGGKGLMATAVLYAGIFSYVGEHLWTRKGLTTPGGLMISVAVSMAALFVYGWQESFGWFGGAGKPGTPHDFYLWIRGGWVPMELATIAAALVALMRYRFPFLIFIIALCLWFLTMDFAHWWTGKASLDWELYRRLSLWSGLVVLAVAWVVDMRERPVDLAYWLHVFGMMIFWGGVTFKWGGTGLDRVLYGLLSVGLILFSVFMDRKVYSVFGALGLLVLLGDLSQRLFKDSILFPFVLTGIGLAVIGLGLWYVKRRDALEAAVNRNIPEALRSLRPPRARSYEGGLA